MERENNSEVEKVGRKNSVIWYHKYSNLIHVDPNHSDLTQPIPGELKNIRSINDSSYIHAMNKSCQIHKYLLMGQ